jgi:monoamine oxidase
LNPAVDALREAGVVVVGAGVAGLAAARTLRGCGVPVTLIDAMPRIGGRAATALVGGEPFDLGATWLHDAQRNPLVALAGPGELVDTDSLRRERTTISGRVATPAEQAALDAAWERLDAIVAPALLGPDTSLAAAMAPMADDAPWSFWAPLIALWEGATIAAVDADQLGLQDWWRNRLDGANRVPAEGVGAFVARVLATPATLSCPATRIEWGGPGVAVETPRGRIAAAAAIVTVSTGVLAAGRIRFDPPLPVPLQTAIGALPMGLLSKIALPTDSRLGLEPGTVLVDRDGGMTFNAFPLGRGHLAGFVGGRRAWALADDPAGFEAFARAELGRMLGPQALADVRGAAAVSDWGTNPAFLGGYAYAGPGDADQRGVLADGFPGERLVFAGEATRTDGLAGTVGGAYLSGVAAAERLLGGR